MTWQKGEPIETPILETRKPYLRLLVAGTSLSTAICGTAFVFDQVHPAESAVTSFNEAGRTANELTASQEKQLILHAVQKVQKRKEQQVASRSQERTPLPKLTDIPEGAPPRVIGRFIAAKQGWTGTQWGCLNALWARESGWNTYAMNSSSGAYGIPQALPGYKMASKGSDWRRNPITQIRWGIGYIKGRYGTPCGALYHSNSYGYY